MRRRPDRVEAGLFRPDHPLWRPTTALLLLAGYCLLHALLRLLLTGTAEVDHVEQVIYAQSLQPHYGLSQPPLYTWLLWGMQRLLGVGLPAVVLLKYLLIFAVYLFHYLAARRLLRDDRLALLATLSLTLCYQIGWKFHIGVTHTLLLSAACAMSLWALLRVLQEGRLRDWALLGLAMGIGSLSKYGYFVFLPVLLLAVLAGRGLRERLLRPQLAIPLLIAPVLFAPFGLGLLERPDTAGAIFRHTLQGGISGDWIGHTLTGLGHLAGAIAGFLALALLLPLLFPETLRQPRERDPWTALMDRFHLLIVLALLGMVAIGGVTTLKSRWMHPFLLLVPLWLFLRLRAATAATGLPRKRLGVLLGVLLVLNLAVIGYRTALDTVGPPLCHRCRVLAPYPELARAVREAGFTAGTILAGDEHIGGNLRLAFPDSRVVALPYTYYRPPPRERPGDCLIVWDLKRGEEPPPQLQDLIAREGLDPASLPAAGEFVIPLEQWRRRYPRWRDPGLRRNGTPLAFGWRIQRLHPGQGECH
ncbi:MAG: hypothetical protein D6786_02470 [Gammaproteobacteria bacterium]|nr:MAG: hypothetical protein D6786_02470 [Gammaproteobacteria bacterium]